MARKPRTTTVDIHGHDARTALSLALRCVAEAYHRGSIPQERLGHSSVMVTLDRYSQVVPNLPSVHSHLRSLARLISILA